jgi:hypothetical protein
VACPTLPGIVAQPGADDERRVANFDFDGEAEAESRQADHRRKQLSDEAFRWLMDDRRGRMLMWERLSDAGLFRTSFNTEPCATAFAEGRRDTALRDLRRNPMALPGRHRDRRRSNPC